jgi:hypothetical protein
VKRTYAFLLAAPFRRAALLRRVRVEADGLAMKVSMGELHVHKLPSGKWEITQPFFVDVREQGKPQRVFEVPATFKTDFASVPRAPLVFWLTGDVSHKAAVIHDYLYTLGEPRKYADAVFRAAMKTEGVSGWRRGLMWAAVRVFGGSHHKAKAK